VQLDSFLARNKPGSQGIITLTKESSYDATIGNFRAAILIVAGLGRSGVIDVSKPVTSIPGSAVPHGGAEKPVSEQIGGAR
jgi:hypothetical protein